MRLGTSLSDDCKVYPSHSACLWFGQRTDDSQHSVEIVEAILRKRPKNCFSEFGTALIAATYSLLPEVVELLLRHGMNPREEAPV